MIDLVTPFPMIPDESKDGKTHLNIWSKATGSKLGRWLSNFAHSPFSHAVYGDFMSMEAYYYWHATGQRYDTLRELHGWLAKEIGQGFQKVHCENFLPLMREGLECKIVCNYRIAQELTRSWLPFQHYYYYGTAPNGKMVLPKSSDWLIHGYTDIRQLLWIYNGFTDRYLEERKPEHLKHLWKHPRRR